MTQSWPGPLSLGDPAALVVSMVGVFVVVGVDHRHPHSFKYYA